MYIIVYIYVYMSMHRKVHICVYMFIYIICLYMFPEGWGGWISIKICHVDVKTIGFYGSWYAAAFSDADLFGRFVATWGKIKTYYYNIWRTHPAIPAISGYWIQGCQGARVLTYSQKMQAGHHCKSSHFLSPGNHHSHVSLSQTISKKTIKTLHSNKTTASRCFNDNILSIHTSNWRMKHVLNHMETYGNIYLARMNSSAIKGDDFPKIYPYIYIYPINIPLYPF